MGFHVYNTPNQALKAEKLAEILSYISNDFAGVVVDDLSDSALNSPTLIDYIEIEDPSGNPQNNNYYEYLDGIGYFPSKDTSVQLEKTYYRYTGYWIWNKWLQGKQITFIGGGINIGYDVPSPNYEDSSEDAGYWQFPADGNEYIYGIDVIVPSDNASISSDAGRVWLTYAKYDNIYKTNLYITVDNPSGNPNTKGYYEYISMTAVQDPTGNPHDNGWYENIGKVNEDPKYVITNDTAVDPNKVYYIDYILTEDTQVVSDKVYYYVIKNEAVRVENAVFVNRDNREDSPVFLDPLTFEYYGNTVWIQKEGFTYNGVKAKRFFIPLCYRSLNSMGGYYNNNIVFRRDNKSYNSFLSARTYYNLLDELSGKFVHRSGGRTKGDIGYLNVTGATIKRHDYDDFDHVVSINRLHLTGIPVKENTNADKTRQYVSNMLVLGGTGEANNDPVRGGYKRGRIYRTSDNWVISLKHGGTGAIDRDEARKKLHFYYDTRIPTGSETKGKEPGYYYIRPKKVDDTTLDYGAVWFRIL